MSIPGPLLSTPIPTFDTYNQSITYEDAVDWLKRHHVTPARCHCQEAKGKKRGSDAGFITLTLDGVRVECSLTPRLHGTGAPSTTRKRAICFCVEVLVRKLQKL